MFCKPWGILPSDVPCHPKLADFANCMKKKGRGMSISASIVEGDYEEKVEESRAACQPLSTYIEHKKCDGVAAVIVAPNIVEGFRLIVQAMGLANLKPNVVCMRYPEIWREVKGSNVPKNFVSIINDCSLPNKAVVIMKGLDKWPGELQKHYGTSDLYWIVCDGGLMLLLSWLLCAKDCYESCKIQVFCIAEENSEADELKTDVKKILYDLRMQAQVIVVTMKSCKDTKKMPKLLNP